MKTFLLPHKFKSVGWTLLVPSAILGLIHLIFEPSFLVINTKLFAFLSDQFLSETGYFTIVEANLSNTLLGIFFIIGALLVAYSKERTEDEFIAGMRLSSLLWAVFVNGVLLVFAFMFFYGLAFLQVMVYNMFTILILFIARFHYVLFNNRNQVGDEN